VSVEAAPARTEVGLGLGCIAIVPRGIPSATADELVNLSNPQWWKNAIEAGLGALPSVTDLEVAVTHVMGRTRTRGDMLSKYFDNDESYDVDLHRGPSPYSFIRFNVTIPKRMQTELMKSLMPEFDTENFQFITLYAENGPVTFIRSLEPAVLKFAHFYPFLVREFLIRELSRVNADLEVVTTGPSPFHADVVLLPVSAETEAPPLVWRETDLMDEVKYYYPADQSAEQAYVGFIELIRGPLSSYYSQVRAGDRRMDRGATVSRMTGDLIKAHTRTGVRAWFSKTFRSSSLAREVMLAAITAAQSDVAERATLRDQVRQVTARLVVPRLVELCDEEMDRSYLDEFEMAKEVTAALEAGRMNQYEVLMISLSTVLGGVAGGIVALIAGL
jgi:hypothetical protein